MDGDINLATEICHYDKSQIKTGPANVKCWASYAPLYGQTATVVSAIITT